MLVCRRSYSLFWFLFTVWFLFVPLNVIMVSVALLLLLLSWLLIVFKGSIRKPPLAAEPAGSRPVPCAQPETPPSPYPPCSLDWDPNLIAVIAACRRLVAWHGTGGGKSILGPLSSSVSGQSPPPGSTISSIGAPHRTALPEPGRSNPNVQGLPSLRRHKANAATAGGDRETPSEENKWSLWKPPVGSTADISSLSPLRFNCCRSSFCPILLVVFETAQGSNLRINISQCPPPKPSKPSKNPRMPDYAIRPIIKHLCHCGLQPHILRCGACLHCHVDSKNKSRQRHLCICAHTYITLHYITLYYITLHTYRQTHTLDKNGSLYDPAGTESWNMQIKYETLKLTMHPTNNRSTSEWS